MRRNENSEIHTKSRVRLLMAFACFCTLLVTAATGSAESETRRKARYYYVAAQQCEARGNRDAAFHLYKKAHQTDPAYEDAAYRYGRMRLQLAVNPFQSRDELLASYSLMRPYVDAYPGDSEENIYYGYVSGFLDSLPEAERVLNRTFLLDRSQSNALLYLSEAYAQARRFGDAAATLSRYEEAEGKNSAISMRKMSYYINEGDTAAAVEEADRLIATGPRNASYQVLKGNLYDVVGQPDSAVVYYLRAERLDPNSPEPKLSLAEYYRQNGDSVAYDNKVYELLLSEDFDLEQKSDILAQYLQTLINDKNDTSRGDYLFSVLSEQYPHEPRVLDLSARYSAAKGDFGKAAESISYALDMQPDNSVMWGQLMTYQAADSLYDDALATYTRACGKITPDIGLKTLYSILAAQGDKYPEAIAMTREMIADVDSNLRTDTVIGLRDLRRDITLDELNRLSAYYASLGDLQHQNGENAAAFVSYENAEELDPDNHMAFNNHAYFMVIDGGDLDRAEQLVRKALKGEDADNPTYLDTLAWIQYLRGDYAAALETQTEAVRIMEETDSGSSELYSHFGDILRKNEKYEEAAEAYRKSIENEKENAAETRAKLDEMIEAGLVSKTPANTEDNNNHDTEDQTPAE